MIIASPIFRGKRLYHIGAGYTLIFINDRSFTLPAILTALEFFAINIWSTLAVFDKVERREGTCQKAGSIAVSRLSSFCQPFHVATESLPYHVEVADPALMLASRTCNYRLR
ncbi:hypothetical protein [Mycoplana rhizolycopersici]|uniref:Uncharacterized protein n=1 Tax=Mycoplana rhizolycopersici TaxID=2746702 RepID=A0ABX2QIJ5_9HYPH|nr:hypothetical protein [Rhizobium rhizolycopersici]NVP57609.1 hypothetical protein [Rhizobium rhizolycopersici]